MIVWSAAVFFGSLIPSRRRIRQRYGMLSIDKLTRAVRNLLIARAGQLATRRWAKEKTRDYASSGFRRRVRARNILRSIGGARLRRFMIAGGVAARFARLLQILGNIDAYVRAFLLRRASNGVNRLKPLLAVRPPHEPVRTQAAPVSICADTS
jgi:hypothetical protein